MDKGVVKIALVDDHKIVRDGLSSGLSEFGISVILHAENGQELLHRLENVAQYPDVIVLDINMPVMDGYLTMLKLVERYPKTKVLALSVNGSEAATIRMMMLGAKGYLEKTCSLQELASAIRIIHTNGIYHTEITNSYFLNSIQKKEQVIPELSEMEMKVLVEICRGFHQGEIAEHLNVNVRKVQRTREALYKMFQVDNPVTLALIAVQLQLVGLPETLAMKT